MNQIITSLKFTVFNSANFMKRSSRREYFTYAISCTALAFATMFLSLFSLWVLPSFMGGAFSLVAYPVLFLIWIPSIALSVRRMHDIGKSGWFVLLVCIPVVGMAIYFIMTLLPSAQANAWGESPLEIQEINEFVQMDLNLESI